MSVITRVDADKLHSGKSGPDQYAPRNRRPLEKLSDVDQAANAFEVEIGEFVRRDVSSLHHQRSDADPTNDRAAKNLNKLIQGVAGMRNRTSAGQLGMSALGQKRTIGWLTINARFEDS